MTVIKIEGEIGWDITAREFSNKLNEATGDIEVHINSVGGSVYQGISMFNAMHSYSKGSVTTVNTAMAASMGSYLMLAGSTIKAYSNATYMIHNALAHGYGNHNDLRAAADKLEKLSNIIADMYAAKTGKHADEIRRMMDDETYLYGNEMLEHGFVDEIIDSAAHLGKEKAINAINNQIVACSRSSKEHCAKDESYNKSLDDILAAMPSGKEKIANQNQGDEMSISQEEFDALNSEKEALAASLAQANQTIENLQNKEMSTTEPVAKESEAEPSNSDLLVVMSYCAANRNIISHAREEEFVKANASLADVMEYALKESENEALETARREHQDDVDTNYLAQAIAKLNGGE